MFNDFYDYQQIKWFFNSLLDCKEQNEFQYDIDKILEWL